MFRLSDTLSTENIVDVKNKLFAVSDYTLDPTSVAYIQFILNPNELVTCNATTLENLIDLINSVYKGDICKHAINAVLDVSRTLAKISNGPTVEEKKNIGQIASVKCIITKLLKLGMKRAKQNGREIILPWDIKNSIKQHTDLRDLIVDADTETLPVTITFGGKFYDMNIKLPRDRIDTVTVIVGGQSFNHNLSFDLISGIKDYYKIKNVDIYVSVFGVPLTDKYLSDMKKSTALYMVSIKGFIRYFNTPDYMTGVVTAAQWLNENVREHVTNLAMKSKSGIYEPLTFLNV